MLFGNGLCFILPCDIASARFGSNGGSDFGRFVDCMRIGLRRADVLTAVFCGAALDYYDGFVVIPARDSGGKKGYHEQEICEYNKLHREYSRDCEHQEVNQANDQVTEGANDRIRKK